MDPRIADYITANRKKYTRQAIRQQLIDAGHDPAEVDRTWAALEAPDADAVIGERFWGRFGLILVGVNVAVFVLVGLLTGMLAYAIDGAGPILPVVLAVALALGALLAWGIVAMTGPAKMSPTTALVVGIAIPLVFALLIGGACYAMVGAIGPPPRQGTMELAVEGPGDISGEGTATCYVGQAGGGFSVFGQREGIPYVTVDINTFPLDGGPATNQVTNLLVSVSPVLETDPGAMYSNMNGTAQLDAQVTGEGLAGTVTFTDLPSDQSGPEFQGPDEDPISGTVSWSCE